MLPISYFVVQPCDVVARMMTSSIAVLPSSVHAVTSLGSPGPAISPYVSNTTHYSSRDESVTSCESRAPLHHSGFNNTTDGCLLRSADQVTWPNVEATPPRDDVIGHLPMTSYDERGRFNRDRPTTIDHAQCRDVISGSGGRSLEDQDGGGRLYPLYCGVCRVRLNGGEQAREHFEGRTHARRVRLTSSASRYTDSSHQVSNSDCCNA